MSSTRDLDLAISDWVADGPNQLDESVCRMVIQGTLDTPQRTRNRQLMGVTWQLAAGTAAAAMLLVGLGWLMTVGPLSRAGGPDPTVAPDATPRPGSTSGRVVDFVRPFTFMLPPDSHLDVTTNGDRWVAFTFGSDVDSGPEHQLGLGGVTVVDATGARTESGFGRADVLLRYPEFFEDLEGNASLTVATQTVIEHDGRPALQGDLEASGPWAYPHIHLDWGQVESTDLPFVDLPYPTRLIVTDVGGRIVLIQVWTRDPADYQGWLPIAMELVDSIDFSEAP
jgi:hypothetical protein